MAIPGNTGQGELWERRLALVERPAADRRQFFSAAGRAAGGIWRVDGSWEAQTYGVQQVAGDSDEHSPAAGARRDFVFELGLAESSIRSVVGNRRVGSRRPAGIKCRFRLRAGPFAHYVFLVGGSIERRLPTDRMSVAGSATSWAPVGSRRAVSRGVDSRDRALVASNQRRSPSSPTSAPIS